MNMGKAVPRISQMQLFGSDADAYRLDEGE
jgi:hypothetical protein